MENAQSEGSRRVREATVFEMLRKRSVTATRSENIFVDRHVLFRNASSGVDITDL